MLKAPRFWYKKVGLIALLLAPLGLVYGFFASLHRSFSKPYRSKLTVISLGNIVMGGAGKTPATIAVAELLQKKGHSPVIITRGYGGKLKGPVYVSTKQHTYRDVGDEALLLCQIAPTIVAKNRAQGIKMADESNADVILLDDGHQTHSVHKDFSFVVVRDDQLFGNQMVCPAGPLREPLRKGLKHASGIIYVGHSNFEYEGLPLFRASIQPGPFAYAGKRVVAFCGLGYPDKFKETLLHYGCQIDKFITFPDHYPYKDKDIEKIVLHSYGQPIVTTAKDFIRIPQNFDHIIHVVQIKMNFENPESIYNFLSR